MRSLRIVQGNTGWASFLSTRVYISLDYTPQCQFAYCILLFGTQGVVSPHSVKPMVSTRGSIKQFCYMPLWWLVDTDCGDTSPKFSHLHVVQRLNQTMLCLGSFRPLQRRAGERTRVNKPTRYTSACCSNAGNDDQPSALQPPLWMDTGRWKEEVEKYNETAYICPNCGSLDLRHDLLAGQTHHTQGLAVALSSAACVRVRGNYSQR